MSTHTDSCIIEHHDDGSRTVTTVETVYPVSKKQQALAVGVLSLIAMAPLVPIATVAAWDKIQERREAKKAAKLKVVN